MPINEKSPINEYIHSCISETNHDRKKLLLVMQKIQDRFHDLSNESMKGIADEFQIRPAEVMSLMTFFPVFQRRSHGKYTIRVCNDISCDLQQKENFLALIQEKTGAKIGETSVDGFFSLELCPCMGMCDQGPIISVNDQVFTRLNPQKLEKIISFYKQETSLVHSQPVEESLALWEGIAETPSYLPIVPGSVIAKLYSTTREELLKELVTNEIIPQNIQEKIDTSTVDSSDPHMIVCNTDLPQSGTFLERILLSDHYDLFLEGLFACLFLSKTSRGIVYLRPEFETFRPVLDSYLERLNTQYQGTPDSSDGLSQLKIEICTSPGFLGGGVGKSVEIAINSDRFPKKSLTSDCISPILIDAKTAVEIGRFLSTKGALSELMAHKSTNLFAISGECSFPGVYELDANSSIGDLVKISGGGDAKAVQVGGVFGTFVSASRFNQPIPMIENSGRERVIVYGPNTDFYEVAMSILKSIASQSCGLCAPCREGSNKLLERYPVTRKNYRYSMYELNSIAECMRLASKCEFGQNATTGFESLMQCMPELI